MIERSAFAKINLFLDIEGLRPDNYHNIISVMQSIDWADKIQIEKNTSKEIMLGCSDSEIPSDHRNTAYKAAQLFLSTLQENSGVKIFIEKNIPHAAGMAGGSADAAAVLLGMNELYGEPFSREILLNLGAKIGADVPFCMVGGTAITTGIGDRIEQIPPLSSCYIICAKKGEGVSTPRAYSSLDQRFNYFRNYTPHTEKLKILQRGIQSANLEDIAEGAYNIFESVVEHEHPFVSLIKKSLSDHGAIVSMMSGSGPSVFGIFQDQSNAQKALDELCAMGATAKICRPCAPQ